MRILSAFVLACLVAACNTAPSESDRALLVSATVTPATFRIGDAAIITVTVENRGARAVAIHHPACPPWFEVLQGATVVAPGEAICAAIALSPKTLEPGASYTEVFAWRGSVFSVRNASTALNPGRYVVRPAVPVGATVYRGVPVGIELTPE